METTRTVRRSGSEEYGTEVMTSMEVELYAEVALKNGATPEVAAADVRLIDTLFAADRMWHLAGRAVMRTKSGKVRKDADRLSMMESVLNGYINGDL